MVSIARADMTIIGAIYNCKSKCYNFEECMLWYALAKPEKFPRFLLFSPLFGSEIKCGKNETCVAPPALLYAVVFLYLSFIFLWVKILCFNLFVN